MRAGGVIPDDDLRERLAALGVTLFRPRAAGPSRALDPAGLRDLVLSLATSADPRLRAALSCVLAIEGDRGRDAVAAVARDHASLRPFLGALYRIARALIASRRPDLERLLGRSPTLVPLPIEPTDLAPPDERHGEQTLFDATHGFGGASGPVVDGGVERTFDTWLRLLDVERRAHGA